LSRTPSLAGPGADFAARYGRRLAIVVPYRDREAHLGRFLPHMVDYFARDKLDRLIDWRVYVIEQLGEQPFNRGALLNAGFLLAEPQSDYVCFHDVDYLPVWADYSYPFQPTRLIWHGLTVGEDRENFFGGVVALDNRHMRAANGYPNRYWGWGFEDVEFAWRLRAAGLAIEHRDGTYQPLLHTSGGLTDTGMNDRGRANAARWRERRDDLDRLRAEDGLDTLAHRVESLTDQVRLRETFLPRVTYAKVVLED
jgi:hypothetical protein